MYSFNVFIVKLTETLGKNIFPVSLVSSCIKQYLHKQYESQNNANATTEEKVEINYFNPIPTGGCGFRQTGSFS